MSGPNLRQRIEQNVFCALTPSIGHNVISAYTSRLVASNIDPFLLARNLFSSSIISDECYRTVTDRHCGMTATQRLEYLVHTIRGSVKTKPHVFRQFLSVLFNLEDTVGIALAEEMITAYEVQEAVELQDSLHLQAHTIQSMVDDTMEKILKWQETRRNTIEKLDDLADFAKRYWNISLLAFGIVITLC
uniref:Uncharacterized protein n=1 Tax=Amphimedon queenslandica TaxID=400682 RepID=A0A1X7VDI9_AMPQE